MADRGNNQPDNIQTFDAEEQLRKLANVTPPDGGGQPVRPPVGNRTERIQTFGAEHELRPLANTPPDEVGRRPDEGMRNYVRKLSDQSRLRHRVTEHPLDVEPVQVKPWGVLALIAFVIGTFVMSIAQIFRDLFAADQRPQSYTELAKDYAKESKRLAKESKKMAKNASKYAKLLKEEQIAVEREQQQVAYRRKVVERSAQRAAEAERKRQIEVMKARQKAEKE